MHATDHSCSNYPGDATDILNILKTSLQVSEQQNDLYRPSSFWAQAALSIVDQVQHHGMDSFRSLATPLSFFVPTYGRPGNSLTTETVEQLRGCVSHNQKTLAAVDQFVGGYTAALADYRVFAAADDAFKRPYLQNFSESDVGNPIEQFEFEGRFFSRSVLNPNVPLSITTVPLTYQQRLADWG